MRCTQKISRHQNKEHEMTEKQIRELRENPNKHQSETKDTIEREIHELKRTTQNIKEKLIQIWKTSEERIKQKSEKLKVPVVKQKAQWKATPAD
jgi:hypothetical protein